MQTIPPGSATARSADLPHATTRVLEEGFHAALTPTLAGDAPDFVFLGPDGSAYWGWGVARRQEADGPARFSVLSEAWAHWRSEGARIAFSVCTFGDDRSTDASWTGVAPGALVMPRVALCRSETGGYQVVVQEPTPLPPVEAWACAPPRALPRCARAEVDRDDGFKAMVSKAVEILRSGDVEKVVLSRRLEHVLDEEPAPSALLQAMRQAQPGAWTVQVQLGPRTRFFAATPELLLRARSGVWETMALAGSRAITEDVSGGEEQLLEDPKERAEHRFVVDGIVGALRALQASAVELDGPAVRRLPHLLHLQTEIRARAPEGIGALAAAGRLHPTPAVGGTPWPRASRTIAELEPRSRGLYAGVVGVLDSDDAQLVVALRSALQEGRRWTTFGGAGIVGASDPEREVRETGQKMLAMLEIFP